MSLSNKLLGLKLLLFPNYLFMSRGGFSYGAGCALRTALVVLRGAERRLLHVHRAERGS